MARIAHRFTDTAPPGDPRRRTTRSVLTVIAVLAVGAAAVLTPRPAAGAQVEEIEEIGQVEITYRIASAGRVSTDLDTFARHVGSTLDDPDGWALGGSIEFTRVDRDADVGILIAQPAAIGLIEGCSTRYSCHVNGEVYINEARWNRDAPGWSLGLERYRHYVVNHEVGHYLGLGHPTCSGSGQPAPVMLQQSKETEPCTNQVWPLASERQRVADRYGVPVMAPGAAAPGDVEGDQLGGLERLITSPTTQRCLATGTGFNGSIWSTPAAPAASSRWCPQG